MHWKFYISWIVVFITAVIIFIAVGVFSVLALLPSYENQLAAAFSKTLKAEVTFDIAKVRWKGIEPVIEFNNIVMDYKKNDPKDKNIELKIAKITFHLNLFYSLISWRPSSNKLGIDGLKMIIPDDGLNQLKWQQLFANNTQFPKKEFRNTLNWLSSQHEIYFTNSALILANTKHKMVIPLDIHWYKNWTNGYILNMNAYLKGYKNLDNLNLNMKMSFDQQGGNLKATGNFDFNYSKLHQLPKLLLPSHLGIYAQKIATNTNFVISNESLSKLNTHIKISKLALANSDRNKKINIKQLNSNIQWNANSNGWSMLITPFSINMNNHLYKLGSFNLSKNSKKTKSNYQLKIGTIDLNLLSKLSVVAPLDLINNKVYRQYANAQISGTNESLNAQVHLTNNKITDWNIKSKFKQLAYKNSAPEVSLSGLTGNIEITPKSGSLYLDSPELVMGKNYLFSLGWPKLNINATINWKQRASDWLVTIPTFITKLDNISANAQGKIIIPMQNPGASYLDFKTSFQSKNIGLVYQRFLPKPIIVPKLYNWLVSNIKGVKSTKGNISFKGNINEYPFKNNNGMFVLKLSFNGGRFSPYYQWPVITEADGNLELNNTRFSIDINKAKTEGASINDVSLLIPNISKGVPSHLQVIANAKAKGIDAIHYVMISPLFKMLGWLNNTITYDGNIGLALSTKFPLGDPGKEDEIKGSINFNNGISTLKPYPKIKLYGITGKIFFNNNQYRINKLMAWLDQNSPISLKLTPNKQQELGVLTGSISSTLINTFLPNYLQHYIFGSLPFKANFNLSPNYGKLNLFSTLEGISSDLPIPFKKSSVFKSLPLHINAKWQGDKTKALNTSFSIADKAKINFNAVLDQGEMSNINFNADIDNLSVDPWILLFSGSKKRLNTYQLFASSKIKMDNLIGKRNYWDKCIPYQSVYSCIIRDAFQKYKPNIHFKFKQLKILDSTWQNVDIEGMAKNNEWVLHTYSPKKVSADFIVPYNMSKPLKLNADYLQIPSTKSTKTANNSSDSSKINLNFNAYQLAQIPALNININNATYKKLAIKSLQLKTNPLVDGMNIPVFLLSNKDNVLIGKMKTSGANNNTLISLSMDTQNLGDLLSDIGYPNLLNDAPGTLVLNLNWSNSIIPQPKYIYGSLLFNFKSGLIKRIKPGLARLLGLFSVESYVSSLFNPSLYLTSKGLPFSSITGKYKIIKGVAEASPFVEVNTPSFDLMITGKVDFVKQMMDQLIKVQPHLSGTLAIAATVFGGPLAGIATFVGNKLVGNTILSTTGITEFKVTGKWNQPEVKSIKKP